MTRLKSALWGGMMMAAAMAGFAGQAEAEAFKMKLHRGSSCLVHPGTEDILWGNIDAGQYVYVQWGEVTGGRVRLYNEPTFAPVRRDGFTGQAIDPIDLPGNGWYVFQAEAKADYALTWNGQGYRPDLFIVKVCFLWDRVGADYLNRQFPNEPPPVQVEVQ